MKTFELKVFDDELLNGQQLADFLDEHSGETLRLSAGKEGPSLGYTGVLAILDEHCERTGRDPNTVRIETSNNVEELPYPRYGPPMENHWWNSCKLSIDRKVVDRKDLRHRRFACLIGRKNPERLAMLYWLRTRDCLLSSMRDDDYHPEFMQMDKAKGWVDDHQDLCQWIHDMEIQPLDDYTVRDQYRAKDTKQEGFGKTHMAVLDYYHNFDIEIVAETWTKGTTFFPTEKTVRPLLVGKPFIMYGARHWMKHLRDMGFMTWGDCWDQSYDDHEGVERWKRMKELINHLNTVTTDDFRDIMIDAKEISLYNQELALSVARR